jgi:hypothetical protein
MLEEFEDVVGEWYFHHQEQPLQHFLCEGHVLPTAETGKCGGWDPLLPGHSFPLSSKLTFKLFSLTPPSMSTGNMDWKGGDYKWAKEGRRGREGGRGCGRGRGGGGRDDQDIRPPQA